LSEATETEITTSVESVQLEKDSGYMDRLNGVKQYKLSITIRVPSLKDAEGFATVADLPF